MNIIDHLALPGGRDESFDAEQLAEPEASTGSEPGSRGKLDALRQRVEQGEQLWHPGDCKTTSVIRGRRGRE